MDTKSSTTHAECIEFTGYKDRNGYGIVSVSGKNKRAHRVAYETAFGQIPAGLVVRHTCDNPSCVNPDHLRTGTHLDNMRDKVDRGRQAKGDSRSNSKLNDDAVRFIRNSELRNSELAEMFNVSRPIISDVRRGKRWAHVQ